MNKGLKIFLIILGVLLVFIVAIGIYAFYSYKQITAVASVASDESFKQDTIALAQGNCSKYSDVESKYHEIQATIRSACANPGVKILIEKEVEKYSQQAKQNGMNVSSLDICKEIDNPNSVYTLALQRA